MTRRGDDALRLLASRLRTALVLLAVAVAFGAAAELAMLRHWTSATQLIAWYVVAVLAVAAGALLWRRVRATVVAARLAGLVAVIGGGIGVVIHVVSNFDAGPLDRLYATTWPSLPWLERLWLASTGGVGPAPPLAPGMLALGGLCLLLGTMGPVLLRPAHRPQLVG